MDCAQHAAGEIRTAMRKIFVMTEKLWNLLLHLQALIATYPQAGKSSPVVASILEKNVAEQPRELLFVRLQITVRTARGVNCPYEQVLCSRLASGLGVYGECMFLKEDSGCPRAPLACGLFRRVHQHAVPRHARRQPAQCVLEWPRAFAS